MRHLWCVQRTKRGPVSQQLIECMTRQISHRGPDDNGIYLDGNIGLGFVRLSIIDLGGGHQPMSNETGDVWVVFNGEIWNYKILRTQLFILASPKPWFHVFIDASSLEYPQAGLEEMLEDQLVAPSL